MDKDETDLLSLYDSNKPVGPSSIPTKILKLLKNDIFCQLADVFDMSSTSDVFPLPLLEIYIRILKCFNML